MFGKLYKSFALASLLFLLLAGVAAAQYVSPNYKINETFFGAGGELSEQSATYQAKVAAGELGIDRTASTNYQAYAGFNTTDKPVLEVFVTGGTYDLGYLDNTKPSAITASFTVRSYLSNGYTVRLGGTPPRNVEGGQILTALITPTAPSTGAEQFGVNLTTNNISPIGPFGADPTQVPDSTFSFGAATADYATSNLFKYVENDIIAQSPSSSGVTQFTLSAIANISKQTIAGYYTTDLFVNVVPTF